MGRSAIQIDPVKRTFTAPSTVTVDSPIMIGTSLVVPEASAASGADFSGYIAGKFYLPKISAQAWVQGDAIYWSGATLTNVQTGTLYQVGTAAAVAANPSSYGTVNLGLGIEADSDIGSFKADLASVAAGKGTALIGDEVSAGTLKAKLDTCGTMAAVGGVGTLIGTAAASRALSDSGVVTANVVTEAAAASGADQIVTSAGASKVVKDSAVAIANVPTMAANGGAGNLVGTAAANKALSDSGVVIANVVTEAAAASGADQFVTSAGASKVVKDSGVAIANVPTMAAAGGVGCVVQTAAADKALSNGGVAVNNINNSNFYTATAAGNNGAGNQAVTSVSGSTPLAGDIITGIVGCFVSVAGTWTAPRGAIGASPGIDAALVNDGGTIKVVYAGATDDSANTYMFLIRHIA